MQQPLAASRPQFSRMNYRVFTVIIFFLGFNLNFCSSQFYFLSNKGGLGRVFDGIGGLSGGGVSTALLPGTILSTGGRQDSCLEYFCFNETHEKLYLLVPLGDVSFTGQLC